MKPYHAKLLSDPDVREIKRALWYGAACSSLAAVHGVTDGMIRHIRNGIHWKHVPWPANDKSGEPLTGAMTSDRARKIRQEAAAARRELREAGEEELARTIKRRLRRAV